VESSTKGIRNEKEHRFIAHIQETNEKSVRIVPKNAQILYLLENDLKSDIIMFKELKGNHDKYLMENKRISY
jgi:hypothetical protein